MKKGVAYMDRSEKDRQMALEVARLVAEKENALKQVPGHARTLKK